MGREVWVQLRGHPKDKSRLWEMGNLEAFEQRNA